VRKQNGNAKKKWRNMFHANMEAQPRRAAGQGKTGRPDPAPPERSPHSGVHGVWRCDGAMGLLFSTRSHTSSMVRPLLSLPVWYHLLPSIFHLRLPWFQNVTPLHACRPPLPGRSAMSPGLAPVQFTEVVRGANTLLSTVRKSLRYRALGCRRRLFIIVCWSQMRQAAEPAGASRVHGNVYVPDGTVSIVIGALHRDGVYAPTCVSGTPGSEVQR